MAMVGLGNLPPAAAHAQVELLLPDEEVLGAGLVRVVPAQVAHCGEGAVDVAPRGADVVAGREMRAGAGEDDDLDPVVLDGADEGGVERVGHPHVLRVAVARPVHRHEGGGAALLVEDEVLPSSARSCHAPEPGEGRLGEELEFQLRKVIS